MEKPLAQAAGLGWQGKHTNLVSREFGSWLFLGAIFTASELPRDEPDTDHCGSCNACQEICPTAAFPAPYKLDARRCISYLTIENKGPIPHEFRKSIGNRIYGCDDCLAVCPWNKFAQQGREAKLAARAELRAPSLAELARLDDAAFRALFSKSPVKRIGRDRSVRHVLIASGHAGDAPLAAEGPRHDKKRALLHPRSRQRYLHARTGRKRPVGPQFPARPCRCRPARPWDRAAPRLRRFRAGAAHRRHVPPAQLHDADRGHD